MPISVKYTWQESQNDMTVRIPYRGESAKKVDLFVADSILKVSFHSHLLDINLFKTVKCNTCKAILKDGTLIINVEKENDGLWHQLEFEGSKEEIKSRRKASLRRREEEIQQQHENARSKKQEEERMAVRMQVRNQDANSKNFLLLLELYTDTRFMFQLNIFLAIDEH